MPGLSYQALGALLILLPGFLTVELVRALSTRPQRTEFEKVIQAFIYSFLAYVLFSAIGGKFPISVRLESSGTEQHYFIEPQINSLLGLLLVAIFLGLIIGVALHFDFPISLLRNRGWTQRTSQVSVWRRWAIHNWLAQILFRCARGIIALPRRRSLAQERRRSLSNCWFRHTSYQR